MLLTLGSVTAHAGIVFIGKSNWSDLFDWDKWTGIGPTHDDHVAVHGLLLTDADECAG